MPFGANAHTFRGFPKLRNPYIAFLGVSSFNISPSDILSDMSREQRTEAYHLGMDLGWWASSDWKHASRS